ncbi:MAG: hypothetical protein ABSD57_10585 [Verrucomicrobiota bacterium]|jgi:hypothetical protein
MTNYLETKIGAIPDKDFKIFISKLCRCVCLDEEEIEKMSLANLFTAIITEKKAMNLQHIEFDGILATKVKNLALDSVVHGVCCELVSRKGSNMDHFAGKTVFMLVKQCYKAVCPPLNRPKKPTRKERAYQLRTDLIKRGRESGSY